MIVDMSIQQPIKFGLTGAEEIVQNVRTILSTIRMTAPLARELGIDGTIIDEPIEIAKVRLTSAVVAAIIEGEPRASVTEVQFVEDHSAARLIPIVYLAPEEGGGVDDTY